MSVIANTRWSVSWRESLSTIMSLPDKWHERKTTSTSLSIVVTIAQFAINGFHLKVAAGGHGFKKCRLHTASDNKQISCLWHSPPAPGYTGVIDSLSEAHYKRSLVI